MACTCSPGSKEICRSCLNKQTKPYVGALVNPNTGALTTASINKFQEAFADGIILDAEKSALTAAVNKYGSTEFYGAVNTINDDFLKRDYVKALILNTPDLEVLRDRIGISPISPLEFASFIRESNYSPAAAIISGNANGSRFLYEMNDFYNGDFTDSVMGGFCSLFGNIFTGLGAFFGLLDLVSGAIGQALKLIEKIKNIEDPLKALFEKLKVTALIEAIKEKVKNAIKKTIEKVKKAIQNFNPAAIMGKVESIIQNQIVGKIENLKEDIQKFFTKENIDALLDKIQKKINYAIGLFANPSIEEIQFLIARICGLATGIEGLIKGLKGPLDDFSNRYQEVFNTLQNAGNRVTGEAIRSGAFRLDPEERQKEINKIKIEWEKMGNFVLPKPDEYSQLPDWETLSSGGDDRLKVDGDWVTDMKPPEEGWTEMDRDVRVMIMRLVYKCREEGIAQYLILNSGYRNPAWNKLQNGKDESQHLSGLAADLTYTGFNGSNDDAKRFVQLGIDVGFRGIGYYNSFTHFDVGPERDWDNR
jgi:hypothetical protein